MAVLAARRVDPSNVTRRSAPVRAPLRWGYIQDWSICDWLCVKVLGPLVEQQQSEACARAISGWREANSVWQRRASVVSFANLAREGDQNFSGFTEMVLDNCSYLLGSQERFAQTGVG